MWVFFWYWLTWIVLDKVPLNGLLSLLLQHQTVEITAIIRPSFFGFVYCFSYLWCHTHDHINPSNGAFIRRRLSLPSNDAHVRRCLSVSNGIHCKLLCSRFICCSDNMCSVKMWTVLKTDLHLGGVHLAHLAYSLRNKIYCRNFLFKKNRKWQCFVDIAV